MNRKTFMNVVRAEIQSLPYFERKEILDDYTLHFDQSLKEGKTEEEICRGLGDPHELAQEYLKDFCARQPYKRKQNSPGTQAILAILLFFANLILPIPLAISLFAALVSMMVGFASLIIVGVFLLGFFFIDILTVTTGIALIALGVLLIMLTSMLFKGLAFVCGKYIEANARLIRGA